jgi:hypothetical protein
LGLLNFKDSLKDHKTVEKLGLFEVISSTCIKDKETWTSAIKTIFP